MNATSEEVAATYDERQRERVCVCLRERESACVCACVCVRERERGCAESGDEGDVRRGGSHVRRPRTPRHLPVVLRL